MGQLATVVATPGILSQTTPCLINTTRTKRTNCLSDNNINIFLFVCAVCSN
eukprot:m.103980 g.103980  ORF g.103980 m.103980 type:complete len:51 (+) comp12627_c0_seq5:2935-3087(+)